MRPTGQLRHVASGGVATVRSQRQAPWAATRAPRGHSRIVAPEPLANFWACAGRSRHALWPEIPCEAFRLIRTDIRAMVHQVARPHGIARMSVLMSRKASQG